MDSNKKISYSVTPFSIHCLMDTRRMERERTKIYDPGFCICFLQGLVISGDTATGLSLARCSVTMAVCIGLS